MLSNRGWIAALAFACSLSACGPPEDGDAGVPQTKVQDKQTSLPMVEPPIDRRALLLAVAEAASAHAAGFTDQAAQQNLEGKRFEIRLRFGCPEDDMTRRGWSYDTKRRTVRFRIDADVGIGKRLIDGIDVTGIESVQGFSIDRPWMLDAVCPVPAQDPTTSDGVPLSNVQSGHADALSHDASVPQLAIVQAFTKDDSRTHLGNDRALTATLQLADGKPLGDSGYDLILSGRLSRGPDGRVIACHENPGLAPNCVVWANFDRIVLSGADGMTIADWSGG